MKTKILLFPLLLLISLGAIIWFIVPGWDRVNLLKTDLNNRELTLAQIREKNKIVDDLFNKFKSNIDGKETIFKFVPKEVNDDTIINSLIHYADLQGGENTIKVSQISILGSDNSKSTAVSSPIANVDPNSLAATGGDPNALGLISSFPITPNFFNVELDFSARYEGMKGFIADLSKLQRSYIFDSFKISHFVEGGNETSLLVFQAKLQFNYMNEYDAAIVDQNLLKGTFDNETITAVKSLSSDVIKVINDSQGRTNPFRL